MKRALLDVLDSRYAFDLPETLVEQEFSNIWAQHEQESQRANRTVAEEGKTEEETQAEYRKIAERRVRLGLVLAEIGQSANVTVEDKDLTDALVERARMFQARKNKFGNITVIMSKPWPSSARQFMRNASSTIFQSSLKLMTKQFLARSFSPMTTLSVRLHRIDLGHMTNP